MKWKKFKIKTVTEAEDIIISTLYDIGLEGGSDRGQGAAYSGGEGADVRGYPSGRAGG